MVRIKHRVVHFTSKGNQLLASSVIDTEAEALAVIVGDSRLQIEGLVPIYSTILD